MVNIRESYLLVLPEHHFHVVNADDGRYVDTIKADSWRHAVRLVARLFPKQNLVPIPAERGVA